MRSMVRLSSGTEMTGSSDTATDENEVEVESLRFLLFINTMSPSVEVDAVIPSTATGPEASPFRFESPRGF